MEERHIQEEQAAPKFVKAKPEILPSPTYAPFLFAVSLLFLGWGLIAFWLISAAGVIGISISVYLWIKDLLHERGNES
jgi:hypothetical protein